MVGRATAKTPCILGQQEQLSQGANVNSKWVRHFAFLDSRANPEENLSTF
jgi:hypothetical protein